MKRLGDWEQLKNVYSLSCIRLTWNLLSYQIRSSWKCYKKPGLWEVVL